MPATKEHEPPKPYPRHRLFHSGERLQERKKHSMVCAENRQRKLVAFFFPSGVGYSLTGIQNVSLDFLVAKNSQKKIRLVAFVARESHVMSEFFSRLVSNRTKEKGTNVDAQMTVCGNC